MVRIEATDNSSSSSSNNLGLVPNLQIANLVIIITINYCRIFLKFFKQAVPPLGSSFMLISYIDVLLTYNFQAVFYFFFIIKSTATNVYTLGKIYYNYETLY